MAVYTAVGDGDLTEFIAAYGLGQLLSYKGIAEGVENSNYFVQTTKGKYILTLYEERVARDDLPFFLSLLEHLAGQGVSCPTPLRSLNGNHLSEIAGRAAALVTFLDGICVSTPGDTHCRAVGRALAKLHLAGRGFRMRRANALGLAAWRPLFERFATQSDTITSGLGDVIRDELAFLESRWPGELPIGIVHADLFPDNVFFLGNELSGLIDFYFACNDALAYDVAICLNAWCFDNKFRFDAVKARAMLGGYQELRRLNPEECRALPVLARGGALRFLLTRSYDWLNMKQGALVNPHNPIDYLERLRFHQNVDSARAYGIEAPP